MTALTLPMMTMIPTVCVTAATLGCVLLTTGDQPHNLLTLLRMLSPRMAMIHTVCVTVVILGCVLLTKRDHSLYHLISPVIPSLTATPYHLPSKRLELLMMPGTKRKRMLMMSRTRATRQSRHPSHQAPLSMISLARTCSSPAGTTSAATNVTTEMSTSLS